MKRGKQAALAAACIGTAMAAATCSFALESALVGGWATNANDCKRLFQRRGGQIEYRQPVDKFAQAAIIQPQALRLPASVCNITQSSRSGDVVKISGVCHDSISYTSMTAQLKIKSGSEIVYSPTGDPVLDTSFVKCPL